MYKIHSVSSSLRVHGSIFKEDGREVEFLWYPTAKEWEAFQWHIAKLE